MSDTVKTEETQPEIKLDSVEDLVTFAKNVDNMENELFTEVGKQFKKINSGIKDGAIFLSKDEIGELISLLDNFFFENRESDPKALEKFVTIWKKLNPSCPEDYVKGSMCADWNKKVSAHGWALDKLFKAAGELGKQSVTDKILDTGMTTSLKDIITILETKETK